MQSRTSPWFPWSLNPAFKSTVSAACPHDLPGRLGPWLLGYYCANWRGEGTGAGKCMHWLKFAWCTLERCALQCKIPISNTTTTATTHRREEIPCWLTCHISLVLKAAKNRPGSPGQLHSQCGSVKGWGNSKGSVGDRRWASAGLVWNQRHQQRPRDWLKLQGS